MAIHSKDAKVYIKEYDLSGDSNRLSLTHAIDTAEVTGFGVKAKEFVEGKYSWAASIDGFWNSTSGQADPTIHNLINTDKQVIGIFPEGTTPAKIGYDGYGILTSYNPEATIAGPVVFSADLQGTDDLWRTTILDAGLKTCSGTISVSGTSTTRNLGTAGLNRGISGVLRAIGNCYGTCLAKIQASTAETGVYGDIFSFATIIQSNVELKNIATAAVGPWFRSVYTIEGESSFELTISCATEE